MQAPCAQAEAFLANRLVTVLCTEEGFYVPEFHPHRLFFTVVDSHYCDMCRTPARHMYRCEVCDFDACPACFNKKDKSTGEGVLRSDKGLREKGEMTNFQYLLRGLRLWRDEVNRLPVELSVGAL